MAPAPYLSHAHQAALRLNGSSATAAALRLLTAILAAGTKDARERRAYFSGLVGRISASGDRQTLADSDPYDVGGADRFANP